MEFMAIQINYNATVLSRFVQSNVSKIIRSVLVLQKWADMCVLPHTIYLCCTKAEVNLTLNSYKVDVEIQVKCQLIRGYLARWIFSLERMMSIRTYEDILYKSFDQQSYRPVCWKTAGRHSALLDLHPSYRPNYWKTPEHHAVRVNLLVHPTTCKVAI